MPNFEVDKYSVSQKDFDQPGIYVPDKKNTAGYVVEC